MYGEINLAGGTMGTMLMYALQAHYECVAAPSAAETMTGGVVPRETMPISSD